MKINFALDPADILESWNGSRTGRRRNLNRVSSVVDLRGSTITLKHAPTGLEVKDSIEIGHFSNTRIKAAEAALRERLVVELTAAVAKHLRVPGR
jgi:hypothetical protein